MIKSLTRITLIVTATLLASNGYSAKDWTSITVEDAWKEATTKGEKRTAQQIFDEDIMEKMKKHGSVDPAELTDTIAKIIKKMSSVLGLGGMDAKNQERIKQALMLLRDLGFVEYKWPEIQYIRQVLENLQTLPNDKSLTKEIKQVLTGTINKLLGKIAEKHPDYIAQLTQ